MELELWCVSRRGKLRPGAGQPGQPGHSVNSDTLYELGLGLGCPVFSTGKEPLGIFLVWPD